MSQPSTTTESPTSAPAAPTPPVPPQPPVAGLLARDAAIRELFRVSGVPATERQLAGLRARRDELRDQLRQIDDRRTELRERLDGERDGDAQQLLRQQITLETGKVMTVEEAIATTDRQIAAAPPELLAATQAVPPPPDLHDLVHEDEAAGIAFSTFGLGVLLTLLVGRWRRARRRGAVPPVATADPHQLQQLGLAVDAIAVEVERIGEGQRFVTQLLAEGRAGQPVARGARGGVGAVDTTADAPRRPGAPASAPARVPTPR